MTPTRASWERFLVPAAVVCAALVATGPAPAAGPPTFTANSTADLPDASPGNGLCQTAAGNCTLRAAVQEANRLGGATINLLAGATYTLTRFGPDEQQAATGDLDLRSNITIAVPGGRAVVEGGSSDVGNFTFFPWNDRIFDVQLGTTVNLSALDISWGAPWGTFGAPGESGGGIFNSGSLTLINSTVSGNSATAGGGIENDRSLTLINSTVSGNSAQYQGGGIESDGSLTLMNSTVSGNSTKSGGGISNGLGGTMSVMNSTVSGNSATLGGGIESEGSLTLTSSTVGGNTASGNALGGGGGVYSSVGSLTLTSSTVSLNSAGNYGGGVYLGPRTSLAAVNSTISNNAAGLDGGGLYNLATADLNNVTVADNVADSDGDGSGDGGGIINVSGGVVSVANTIVGDNVDGSANGRFPDCLGSLTSRGFNLVENTAGCAIGGVTTSNITGRDPQLGPLRANGRLTFTHALLLGETKFGHPIPGNPSPAIDSGNPLFFGQPCSRDNSENGVTRPVDGNADGVARCDIGAYEVPAQQFPLGTWALTPATATAHVGERLIYSLTWTVPAPLGWRSLDTLQLRFVDHEQTALWIRFQEIPGSPGLFSVIDSQTGEAGPSFAPGSRNKLKGDAAKLYLATTSVDGPLGSRVTLQLTVSFKGRAARHTFDVQVLSTDDSGGTQGFHRTGTVSVARGERDDDDSDSDSS